MKRSWINFRDILSTERPCNKSETVSGSNRMLEGLYRFRIFGIKTQKSALKLYAVCVVDIRSAAYHHLLVQLLCAKLRRGWLMLCVFFIFKNMLVISVRPIICKHLPDRSSRNLQDWQNFVLRWTIVVQYSWSSVSVSCFVWQARRDRVKRIVRRVGEF